MPDTAQWHSFRALMDWLDQESFMEEHFSTESCLESCAARRALWWCTEGNSDICRDCDRPSPRRPAPGDEDELDWPVRMEYDWLPPTLLPNAPSATALPPEAPGTPVAQEETNEILVTIVRNSKPNKIGLDVIGDGTVLRITRVKEGAVERWNFNNPDKLIHPGDYIVEVNGLRGNAKEMLKRLGNTSLLNMVIERSHNTEVVEFPEVVQFPPKKSTLIC